MEETLTREEQQRIEMVQRMEQDQVLADIRNAIAQLPEQQRWRTEAIVYAIRALVNSSRLEGQLALALIGAELASE